MFNKPAITAIAFAVLIICWVISLSHIMPEHVSHEMAMAIVVPILLTLFLFWHLSRAVPTHLLKSIRRLSVKIQKDLQQNGGEVDTTDIPDEILPLVDSINTLLRHQNDRYQQERNFSANASHELRTPLAGIRIQAELASRIDDPIKRQKALDNILYSVDRGTRLVDQLLTLSRLTAEEVDLAIEKVQLNTLARRVLADNQVLAEPKNIELSFMPNGQHHVFGNKESIRIMLDNVIRNAILHASDGGQVVLRVAGNENYAMVRVDDTGPGIPAEKRAHVLKRFEKGGQKTMHEGSGLGLAIVKRILDLHSGTIHFSDTEHAKTGLSVLLTLPVNS